MNKVKIEKYLEQNEEKQFCDDCLSEILNIHSRQQVNQLCRELFSNGIIERGNGICSKCGKNKIVNKIKKQRDICFGKLTSPDEILTYPPQNTLIVVSCTKTKVWNIDPTAPDFVPAKCAYKGRKFLKFLRWAEEKKIEEQGFFWVILSGKYGFIEPWHPISRYNVHIGDSKVAISGETLKRQVSQSRWWRDKENKIIEIKLSYFNRITCINCEDVYIEKIKKCFPEALIRCFEFNDCF